MLEDAQMEKKEKGFVAHLFTWFAVVFIAAALYVRALRLLRSLCG